jgi:hypothetical protein
MSSFTDPDPTLCSGTNLITYMTIQTGDKDAEPTNFGKLAELNFQNGKAVFTGGRFNAPTPGHMRLIEKTCSIANKAFPDPDPDIGTITDTGKEDIGADTVFVLLTKTDCYNTKKSPEKYPLTCVYKLKIVNEMIKTRMQQIILATTDESKKTQLSNMKIIVICVQALSAYKYVVDSINRSAHFDDNTDLPTQGIEASTQPIRNVIFCLGKETGNDPVEKLIIRYPPDKVEVELMPINRGETSMKAYANYDCKALVTAFTEFKETNTKSVIFDPETMSGTLVRNIVNCGHSIDPTIRTYSPIFYEMFKHIYSNYLSEPTTILDLYDKIYAGLNHAELVLNKSKSSKRVIDDKSVKNSPKSQKVNKGGRKTKRRHIKKTKGRNSKKYRVNY